MQQQPLIMFVCAAGQGGAPWWSPREWCRRWHAPCCHDAPHDGSNGCHLEAWNDASSSWSPRRCSRQPCKQTQGSSSSSSRHAHAFHGASWLPYGWVPSWRVHDATASSWQQHQVSARAASSSRWREGGRGCSCRCCWDDADVWSPWWYDAWPMDADDADVPGASWHGSKGEWSRDKCPTVSRPVCLQYCSACFQEAEAPVVHDTTSSMLLVVSQLWRPETIGFLKQPSIPPPSLPPAAVAKAGCIQAQQAARHHWRCAWWLGLSAHQPAQLSWFGGPYSRGAERMRPVGCGAGMATVRCVEDAAVPC